MAEEFTHDELYSSLLKWLESCLELAGTVTFNPANVSDGNSLADCLVQLAPDFFTPSWRSRIITETGGNWKLKLNNLKKIHRSVQDYYDSVLHISLNKFKMPDLTLIAEIGNKEDTARLIQLVLGIAINCVQKDTYIQAIMGMQQDVQHVVMGAIQDLISLQTPSMVTSEDYKALEEEHKQGLVGLEKLRKEVEVHQQDKHELTNSLKNAREELSNLNVETETLRGELKAARSVSGSGDGKSLQLQRLLDVSKTEKLKLETERDDFKHKCAELENQLQDVLERNRALTQENEEIPILRDSVEEMKYLESKVRNYESVISQYKAKVEDAQEVRRQLKAVEDRNLMYMQQNMDLEEELRRQGGLKKQLENQRQKVQEVEAALVQEKLRCLEAAQEAEEKSQMVENLQLELLQVKQDRDNLSQQVPGTPLAGEFGMFSGSKGRPMESPTSFSEPDGGSGGGGGGVGGMGGLMEAFTPEMREKMVKLEKENQILQRRVDAAESASQEAVVSVEGGVAKAPGTEVVERVQKEGLEWKRRAKEAEQALKKYVAEVTTLEEVRKAKDLEIEKYKKYLNKAKKIIENIGEAKSQAGGGAGGADSLELQNLKTLLKEKDKQIEQLEREYHQGQASWEREERLVVSAWHELGLLMHRKFSQDRLLTKQKPSFLAQQRQSLYENPVPINTAAGLTTSNTTSSIPTHTTGYYNTTSKTYNTQTTLFTTHLTTHLIHTL